MFPRHNRRHVQLQLMRQTAPSLKGAASDVAFRYVLNIGACRLDQRVTYDKFHYAATCGRVSDESLFPPVLPHYLSGYYCENEEEASFHARRLRKEPSPAGCEWIQKFVKEKRSFICALIQQRDVYWCAKCNTMLMKVSTGPFEFCVRRRGNWYTGD
jgi:hypothetical protein